jgi:hypothetical protein
MDANKIKERFETRKNTTKNALKDFTQICDWITGIVDDVNIRIEKKIRFRATRHFFDSQSSKYSDQYDKLEIAVIEGECGLFITPDDDDEEFMFELNVDCLDYVNLQDLQESLNEIFKKLESFSTREDSANKITSILNIINQ